MHDLLQLFAHEQLGQEERRTERQASINRLMAEAVKVSMMLSESLRPSGLDTSDQGRLDPPAALAWLEAERYGLIALAGDAAEHGRWQVAWLLAQQLDAFLHMRGFWVDRERVDRWAVQAAEQAGDRAAEGYALHSLGTILIEQGQWPEATDCFQQALTIWQQLGESHSQAIVRLPLGAVLHRQGRTRQAIEQFRQALMVFRQIGDRANEGQALNNLANVLADQHHWQQAIDYYHQDLAICRELGDRYGEAQTLNNLAGALAKQGDQQEAIDHYHQALTIFEQLGAPEAAKVRQALAQLDR